MKKTRVWILDDHGAIRALLEEFINSLGDFTVVGSSGCLDATKAAMEAAEFDLLLLDLDLEGGSGLDLLETTQTLSPYPQVVIISADVSVGTVSEVKRFRIAGYVTKSVSLDEFAHALRRIRDGELFYSHEALAAIARQFSLKLTDSELRLAKALADTDNRWAIAKRLGISLATTRRRLSSLFQKIGAAAPEQFLRRALALGLISASRQSKPAPRPAKTEPEAAEGNA